MSSSMTGTPWRRAVSRSAVRCSTELETPVGLCPQGTVNMALARRRSRMRSTSSMSIPEGVSGTGRATSPKWSNIDRATPQVGDSTITPSPLRHKRLRAQEEPLHDAAGNQKVVGAHPRHAAPGDELGQALAQGEKALGIAEMVERPVVGVPNVARRQVEVDERQKMGRRNLLIERQDIGAPGRHHGGVYDGPVRVLAGHVQVSGERRGGMAHAHEGAAPACPSTMSRQASSA